MRAYSQSIASSAISVSSRAIDAVAMSNSCRARDSPKRATSVAASSFMPVSTWPPLRELAPQPICSRSMTDDRRAGARQLPRRRQAGITGADDHDVRRATATRVR